jgi:hypothetical protein
VDVAEESALSLLELIEHVRQGDRGHLSLLHAVVSHLNLLHDVVADFGVSGFDDDAEVVNVLADHFDRPDLRVELDFGFGSACPSSRSLSAARLKTSAPVRLDTCAPGNCARPRNTSDSS